MARNVRVKTKWWKDPEGSPRPGKDKRGRSYTGKWKKAYQVLGPCPKTGEEIVLRDDTGRGTFKLWKDAEAHAKTARNRLYTLTEVGKMESRTVADLADAFLKDRRARCQWTVANDAWHEKGKSFSPQSLDSYESALKCLLSKLGPIVLISLAFDDIQTMVDEVSSKHGRSKGRMAGLVARAMLRWGAFSDWVMQPKLITRLSVLRLPPDKAREEIPRDDDVRACLAVVFGPRGIKLKKRSYLHRRWAWLMMLANGPRRGEIVMLHWEDLHLDKSAGAIEHGYCVELGRRKPTKSKAGKRPLYIPKHAHEVLDAIREMDGGATDLVMKPEPGRGRNAYASLGPMIRLVAAQAGIPKERRHRIICSHGFRHWNTSHLDNRGVGERTRKLLLGHSGGQDVTIRYTHVLPIALTNAFAEIQGLVDDFMPASITPLSEALDVEGRIRAWHRQHYHNNRERYLAYSRSRKLQKAAYDRERYKKGMIRNKRAGADKERTNASQASEEAT